MKFIGKFLFIIIILSLIKTNAQEADKLKNIIKNEIKKYPEMEIQDVYKLIQQAAMGSEHAMNDTSAARMWMENEVVNLDWNHEEKLIDTISPGGDVVRVNLRPYLKAGYKPDKLLNAFIATANNFNGSIENLKKYINVVLEMIDNGEISFSKETTEKYFAEMKAKGYPAVHHSRKYEEKYSPAYRVVAEEYVRFIKRN